VVIKIIQTVCQVCSKPLVALTPRFTEKMMRVSPPVRMTRMLKMCISKRFCGHCGSEHPRFVRDNFQIYIKTGKKKEDKDLYPIEFVYRTLDRMSTDTVRLLGFDSDWSHPRNLICTVIPIAPPAIRPSMLHDASLRSEGDLTFGLLEIVKVMGTCGSPSTPPVFY
jgi:DNA-directed RNA polymerase beta' subunit